MKNKERILKYLSSKPEFVNGKPFTTFALAEALSLQRSNISTLLNELVRDGKIQKKDGRPVEYSLIESDVFAGLVGYKSTYKNAIQLAEAALLYPGHPLNTLIIAERGAGMTTFVTYMLKYGYNKLIFTTEHKVKQLSVMHYTDDPQEIEELLFNENSGLLFSDLECVFIDHLECLSQKCIRRLLQYLNVQFEHKSPTLILGCDRNAPIHIINELAKKVGIRIDLPNLKELKITERFALVQKFFVEESIKMNRELAVDANTLACLLSYSCDYQMQQLKSDIHMACAKAYVSSLSKPNLEVAVEIEDFDQTVLSGTIISEAVRSELAELFPLDRQYRFKKTGTEIYEFKERNPNDFYVELNKKIATYKENGYNSERIAELVQNDLNNNYENLQQHLWQNNYNSAKLEKFVNDEIIKYTKDLLEKATIKLNMKYDENTFFGLCIHTQSLIYQPRNISSTIGKETKQLFARNYEAYKLCLSFIKRLERHYDVKIPETEIVYLIYFLTRKEKPKTATMPMIVAFHGNGIADEIVEVIKQLINFDETIAFDLPINEALTDAYERFKEMIRSVKAKELAVFYDSGSIQQMCRMAEQEVQVVIHCFQIPLTITALDIARKIAQHQPINTVFSTTQDAIIQIYAPNSQEKIILTLCTTGEGGAKEIKGYLEAQGFNQYKIINLAMIDENKLKENIAQIKKEYDIVYMIGSYNPNISDIPFLSFKELFQMDRPKLESLFSLGYSSYHQEIYDYLADQLPMVSITKLKKYLPRTLKGFNSINSLDETQTVGLLVHITVMINRILTNQPIVINPQKASIIANHRKEFKQLVKSLKPLERNFKIIIPDDEIATILMIILKA